MSYASRVVLVVGLVLFASAPGFSSGAETPPAKKSGETVSNPNLSRSSGSDRTSDLEQKETSKEKDGQWSLSDKIAAIASGAAFLQFIALVVTIWVMVTGSRRQLRAYLCFKPGEMWVDYDAKKGSKFEFRPSFKNCGLTPAMKVRTKVNVDVFPLGLPGGTIHRLDPDIGEGLLKSSRLVVGPEQTTEISHVLDRDFSPHELKSIKNLLGVAIYVWGTAVYEDIFATTHRTDFCCYVRWDTAGQMSAWTNHHDYNDAD